MGVETLINFNDKDLHDYCYNFLKTHYSEISRRKDEYLYAYGDLPLLLVAHLDTVFSDKGTHNKELYYDKEKQVQWCPEGAGFDDRAGVDAIIQLVEWSMQTFGKVPSVLFTHDEELGGIGASSFCDDCLLIYGVPLVKFIIELDRQGRDDCVFYNCHNLEFIKYIQHKKFCYSYGTFSDITFFAKEFDIAAVNLSIGYENEHSLIELLHVDWMNETIEKVKDIIKDLPDLPYYAFENKIKN